MNDKEKLIRITTVPTSLKVLLKGQLKYMSNFFEVIGISSPGKSLDDVAEFEEIRTIPIKMTRKITPLKDFFALLKLINIFLKIKPDIVHTHTPKAGLLGMLASYITGIPIRLHTVAGLPLTETKGIKKRLLVFIEKLTYSCATNVYPNSHKLKKYILDNKFCSENKLKIIGNGSSNGIDINYFKLNESTKNKALEIRNTFKIPKNAFVFLFVGRIVKDKGINELIEAFIGLKSENIYLLLVGNYENNLDPVNQKSINEIKNNKKIIFAGYQKDVRPFFAASDVFVFPSYREGFPNVVLQSGAMEVPAVVSNINGCNEIIKHNYNGLIVEVKDILSLQNAMNELFRDPKKLLELKKNCRVNVMENYDRNYFWKQLLNEYKSLLKNV